MPSSFFCCCRLSAALLIVAGTAEAENVLTVSDLVGQALKQHALLAVLQARIDEGVGAAQQARAWANPELELGLGRKSVNTFTGPAYEISAIQMFAFPGKRGLRRRLANFTTDQARAGLTRAEVTVHYDVLRLAYAYETARRKVEYSAQRLNRFELIETFLKSRPFASPQQRAEREIVRHRLYNLTTDLLELEGVLSGHREELAFYVGSSVSENSRIEVHWFDGTENLEGVTRGLDSVRQSPAVEWQKLAWDRAAVEATLARREAWPDVGLFARYSQERAGEMEVVGTGGLSFALPVLNVNRGDIQRARSKLLAEEQLYRLRLREVETGWKRHRVEYETSKAVVAKYPEEAFADWERQLGSAEGEFRKGRVDLLTFLELDEQITESVFRALEGQVRAAQAYGALYSLTGERRLPGGAR